MLFKIMMIMFLISILFLKSKHPLSMGLIVIMQSICISIIVGLIKSFMFSYIMIMIMMSGMLVLFMYMSSVASNEKFNMNYKFMWLLLLTPALFFYPTQMMYNINMVEEKSTLKYNIAPVMEKLFSTQSTFLIIMTVLYLFFTMIVISSIVNIHEGPMRSKS